MGAPVPSQTLCHRHFVDYDDTTGNCYQKVTFKSKSFKTEEREWGNLVEESGCSSPTLHTFLEAKQGLVQVFLLQKRIYHKISELRF